eukprot:CAMPEP_0182840382 /NCGR_PEP_ID=MMETSP0006_2-20121128/24410_1 /TAXON_ID=97485 /ORGANISM="Prymnesium parvum, Strain Texoma1" /LENGTH=98 /DNA_ID=CAMNT_0024969675 /DNA_START=240 /DNA_END=533 /DNA_ORIENTATION=-
MFGQNPLSGSIIGADYHLQATSILIIDHPFQTERFFRKGLLMGLLQEVYDPLVTHFDLTYASGHHASSSTIKYLRVLLIHAASELLSKRDVIDARTAF